MSSTLPKARRARRGLSAKAVRRLILEESRRANVGHIGSALSIADIVTALYGSVLSIDSPDDPERDRFILSKGHASLALYAALHLRGWIDRSTLATYCADGSLLGVHPERELTGVDYSTGSLGQGLSFAAGAAFAARLQGSRRRVFALISDAECDEGSVWEAVLFAAQRQLANLCVIVDLNGQQALGYTKDVLALPDLASTWRAFGWDTHEVGGHDVDQLSRLLHSLPAGSGSPHAVIAKTTFGRGVSFMENRIEWHYLPMDDRQYDQALSEVAAE